MGTGLHCREDEEAVWTRPEAVAQIEFLEWTGADHLRHTKFVGLRDDKDPQRSFGKRELCNPLRVIKQCDRRLQFLDLANERVTLLRHLQDGPSVHFIEAGNEVSDER